MVDYVSGGGSPNYFPWDQSPYTEGKTIDEQYRQIMENPDLDSYEKKEQTEALLYGPIDEFFNSEFNMEINAQVFIGALSGEAKLVATEYLDSKLKEIKDNINVYLDKIWGGIDLNDYNDLTDMEVFARAMNRVNDKFQKTAVFLNSFLDGDIKNIATEYYYSKKEEVKVLTSNFLDKMWTDINVGKVNNNLSALDFPTLQGISLRIDSKILKMEALSNEFPEGVMKNIVMDYKKDKEQLTQPIRDEIKKRISKEI